MNILDCTMRDGGYQNKWNFSTEFAQNYLELMDELDIEFVELGFRFLENNGFLGPFAFTSDKTMAQLKIPKNLKIGVMVNASEFISVNIDAAIESIFPLHANKALDFVRVAANFSELELALRMCEILRRKYGYVTFINIMQMSFLDDSQLQLLVKKDFSALEALYLADSTGSMRPEGTKRIFSYLQENCKVPVGIHAHDNLGLAFANTLAAKESGAKWLDGTLLGMGRGAGNTKSEQLWLEISDFMNHPNELIHLMNFLDGPMVELMSLFPWGRNLEFEVAGRRGIHPTFVQNLLDDHLLNTGDRFHALKSLADHSGRKYSENLFHSAKTYSFQPMKQSSPLPIISSRNSYLLISNSILVKEHFLALEEFIQTQDPIVVSVNQPKFVSWDLVDFIASISPIRLQQMAEVLLPEGLEVIAPLDYLESIGFEVPQNLGANNFTVHIQTHDFEEIDGIRVIPKPLSAFYALSFVLSHNPKTVYFAGFDGAELNKGQQQEMQRYMTVMCKRAPGVNFVSLLENSLNLPTKSVYGYL
jgi:4-hydroxy 2-oxovalerate aldolase